MQYNMLPTYCMYCICIVYVHVPVLLYVLPICMYCICIVYVHVHVLLYVLYMYCVCIIMYELIVCLDFIF